MQDKEIELKFGFDGDASNLYEIFSHIGAVSNKTTLHLDNTYFDTEDKDLFSIHAGLRIRRGDDFSEQTLKVKGENIGGLHKRKEYNLPIEPVDDVPNLLKFPKDALPEDFDVESIQKRLKPICRINFTRYLFNLELLDSTFEVAYDQGFIEVDSSNKYPLSELEIELKETSVHSDELLNLFSILCTHLASNNIPLLLEPFSKMHRAALLQEQSSPTADFSELDKTDNFIDYVTAQVALLEKLYGYFLISHDAVLFSQITSLIDSLLLSLKYLKRRKFLAFIIGRKEPVEYKRDLQIIIRLLKAFHRVCRHVSKKMLLCRFRNNSKGIASCYEKIRLSEKNNKMFLIPLKLRLLMSLMAK